MDPGDLLAAALPARVLTASSRIGVDALDAFPAEVASLGRATRQRRNAFATGRHLARELLMEVGSPQESVLRRFDGVPIWPSGVCGSFSYKSDWCAVAIAASPPYAALGIDIEKMEPFPSKAWEDVVSPEELQSFSKCRQLTVPLLVNLAFSAKEAYFKAHCSMTGDIDLEFRDVELQLDWANGCFSLNRQLPDLRVIGCIRWNECWCAAGVLLLPRDERF